MKMTGILKNILVNTEKIGRYYGQVVVKEYYVAF